MADCCSSCSRRTMRAAPYRESCVLAGAAGCHRNDCRENVPIRAVRWRGSTAGVAPGHAQANLVAVPRALADDFHRFCELNPKPCPLIESVEPGSSQPRESAPRADLRTDLPAYRVFTRGRTLEDRIDLLDLRSDDLSARHRSSGRARGAARSRRVWTGRRWGPCLRYHVTPGTEPSGSRCQSAGSDELRGRTADSISRPDGWAVRPEHARAARPVLRHAR